MLESLSSNPGRDAASKRDGEIRLIALTKTFGETQAVKSISLTIPHGSYCCLIGPSGCGKTTILRMIAGHETPTAGEITIGGQPVVGLPPVRRGTALMFQSYALFPHLTVRDNVGFNLKMRGDSKADRNARVEEMLAVVHMGQFADRMPAQLSGGQQQRVALARALITNPRVLLLDEPLSALDEFLRLRMRGELKRLQVQLGITFVHVTHTQPEAIALADTVVVMNQGSIEQAAPPHDVYALPRSPYVARFMGGQNVVKGIVRAIDDGTAVLDGPEGSRIRVRLGGRKFGSGEEAYVAIRRDKVVLTRGNDAGDGGENTARGVVETVEYQGIYFKVTLAKLAGEEFIATEPEATFFAHPIKAGETVVASWRTDDVHLLEVDRSAGGGIQPYSDDTSA